MNDREEYIKQLEAIIMARNETGNHIEPFVVFALRKVGLRADKPRTKSGKI
ncbi:hypothetical protein M1N61_02875 [Peptococcaceae bacterium]|nr:hypothetical protein [Peptococcaceae bacterium]